MTELALADDLDLDRDIIEMANLYPRTTGLPMTVWINPKGRARHDVRVKVCMTPGNRMDSDNLAVFSVRPTPELLHGHLSATDIRLVQRWITQNESTLVGYWNGELDTLELAQGLRPI